MASLMKIDFWQSNPISYFAIFSLFFLMCLGLGYPTLNRFYPPDLNQLSDTVLYFNIVENGFSNITADEYGRSTRFFTTGLARLVYLVAPTIGTWDKTSFSMLVANSCFVSAIACLTYFMAIKFSLNAQTGLIACFLLLLNFQTTNIFLAGLVEAGFCLMILLFSILSYYGRYFLLPMIAFLGVLSKEVFLPFLITYSFCFILFVCYEEKKLVWPAIISFVSSCVIGIACFLYLKFLAFGSVINPMEHAENLRKGIPPVFSDPFGTLFRFSYVFIWLFPLALPGLKNIPRKFIFPIIGSLVPLIILGTIASISGNGYARVTFTVIGPILCIAAAANIQQLISKRFTN